MNGHKYLLDTCFILDFYKRDHDVLALISKKQIEPMQCTVSVINRMEVLGYAGLTATDEQFLTRLLANFECLPLSPEVEQETIKIRKACKIKLPDAIVLATAKVHQLTLLTQDIKLQKLIS